MFLEFKRFGPKIAKCRAALDQAAPRLGDVKPRGKEREREKYRKREKEKRRERETNTVPKVCEIWPLKVLRDLDSVTSDSVFGETWSGGWW